jgi:hypothetical protein
MVQESSRSTATTFSMLVPLVAKRIDGLIFTTITWYTLTIFKLIAFFALDTNFNAFFEPIVVLFTLFVKETVLCAVVFRLLWFLWLCRFCWFCWLLRFNLLAFFAFALFIDFVFIDTTGAFSRGVS